jgi:hypothetical protein
VGGKPEVISQHYLGKAADIEAAMAGATVMPDRTRHLAATRLPGLTAFETRRVVFGVERLIVVTTRSTSVPNRTEASSRRFQRPASS